jgi:Domain of unknown function (DUF4198)
MQRLRVLPGRRTSVALGLVCATLAVQAHDTWFETQQNLRSGTLLALGTGNQFPQMETGLVGESLAQAKCQMSDGSVAKLPALPAWLATTATAATATPSPTPSSALQLLAPPAASSCFTQLKAFDIEITADKVALYLKEIQAPAPLRARWADLQKRGLPWRERYVKHARILLAANAGAPAATGTASGTPMGMDLHIEGPTRPLQAGDSFTVQVQRDGQALPHQAIELRSDSSRYGFWRQSDAQGRMQFTVPLAGRWLLRGTDLRAAVDRADAWDSRFVTLAFDVAPHAAAAP